MKKLPVAALCLTLVFIVSCQPEKPDDINFDLLGTWKLDRTVEQEYKPINTLIYDDEYVGLPGDSVIFKANGMVYQYSDGETEVEEAEYKVINDSTISIEFELYKIRRISEGEVCLYEEETDQALDERWIYAIYLKR